MAGKGRSTEEEEECMLDRCATKPAEAATNGDDGPPEIQSIVLVSGGAEQCAQAAAAAAAAATLAPEASKGKVLLPAGDVKLILCLKREELPSIDYLDHLAEHYTPEEIVERRRRHEEDVALCRRIDDNFEVFQKEVRDSIMEKGYYEVDDGYLERKKEFNAWTKEQWARISKTKLRYCAPDADQATQGYIEDSDFDDDDFASDGEDA